MKLKRLISTLVLTLVLMFSFSAYAAPVEAQQPADDPGIESVSPRAEEFQWYYRIHEGRYQRRLWSLTRGVWVTDWEDC